MAHSLVAPGTRSVRSGSARSAGKSVARMEPGWEASALLLLTVGLMSFGFIMVYSASSVMASSLGLPDHHFLLRQAAGGAVSVASLAVLARIDYRVLRRLAWPLILAMITLLTLVVLPQTVDIAPRINGARRWLALGPLTFQPSEFAKLVLIIWTAMLAVKKQDRLNSLSRGLLPFLLVWSLVAGLIFLEPNLSTALLTLLLAGLVVFAAGGRVGHFVLLAIVGVPLLWSQVEQVGYRMRRVATFLDPSHDPAGMSYQINQSLIAVGSGGVVGRGFGSGQQKFGFVPEPHNDFILAMIGEEWGFVGLAAVVALFTAFGLVGYRVARQAPDLFGCLLAVGATNLIVVQAFLHIAVNLALIPTTGVSLPFISYGRSSLLVSVMAVAILISIARAGALERQVREGVGTAGDRPSVAARGWF